MTDTLIVQVHAPKGGQGCTTVACLMALAHAEQQQRTLLVDRSLNDQAHATLGIPGAIYPNKVTHVSDYLDVVASATEPQFDDGDDDTYATIIIDEGFGWKRTVLEYAKQVWVVRNEYVALYNYTRIAPHPIDHLVLVHDPSRVLRQPDVEAVVYPPSSIIVVPLDPAIARASDAGLLSTRAGRFIEPFITREEPDVQTA